MHPLVTPSWLQSHLSDPGTIILDATLPPVGVRPIPDVRASYLARHIPGAVYFDIEEFSLHSVPLPHMLPTPEEFARKAGALGISSEATIVLYEQEGVFSAPRAWWMFRTMRASQVLLLDGGLKAWLAAGYPTASGPEIRQPTVFDARYNAAAVRDFTQIQQAIGAHSQILDARSAARFSGIVPEPRPGLRSGHMAGAINIPFTELQEQGSYLAAEKLGEIFAARGVNLDQPIITTCGSGVTAAVVSLALELAGAEDVSLYDGSWAEYGQHPDTIVESTT
jgi:thiosulfate/3-mercaptopyruvate sulfurtransferase